MKTYKINNEEVSFFKYWIMKIACKLKIGCCLVMYGENEYYSKHKCYFCGRHYIRNKKTGLYDYID